MNESYKPNERGPSRMNGTPWPNEPPIGIGMELRSGNFAALLTICGGRSLAPTGLWGRSDA